jgi:hypothetical protein
MQQWLGSQGLPTSYPTQAALVAAYDAAREAEKKAKEQEALNDAYQSFKQADQQSMPANFSLPPITGEGQKQESDASSSEKLATKKSGITWKYVLEGIGIWILMGAIDAPIIAGLIMGNLGDELIFALFEPTILMITLLSITGYTLGWKLISKGFTGG